MEEMDVLEIEIDKELKEQAEALLQKIGMDLETAIILFIEECVRIHPKSNRRRSLNYHS